MNTKSLHQLSMIPHITTQDVSVEYLLHQYWGWVLLEIDEEFEQILICKPCTTTCTYTRSKHLIILCDDVALAWMRASHIDNGMNDWVPSE